MAIPIISTLTDLGRQHLADMSVNGTSFIIQTFTMGNGGHDTGNPSVALTPDPSLDYLPDQFFGPKEIEESLFISPTCPAFNCEVTELEAVGELSNIGLWARVVWYPDCEHPPCLGEPFLYAVGNFPLRVKTDVDDLLLQISIQY